MTSLHDPRAHEQGGVDANRLVVSKQPARPTELGLPDLVGGSAGLQMSRTMSSLVVCSRPLPGSSWMSERDGRLCEG